ncbi:oxidoreductase [Novosphingobium lentum]|uniref:oxidoreductase n=1 Tax=Novosphingobium lentum TaxID=145287 RepID=UPI00082F4280|nr:oxidoreductase [Novosphingobium lentum]
MPFTAADVPGQQGRTFLVTGANAGIGFEASRVLAARGARVIMACRDKDRAEAAMARIAAEVPGAALRFVPLDQADIASVRAAAALLADEPIDVLVNNAGVMVPPLTRTAQGRELQFGVNHLGTFALTALLLPQLAKRDRPRIVVTGSVAHKRGAIDWNDIDALNSYSKFERYSASKLANLLFLFELDRRLKTSGSPVSAIGCHPGVSLTELARHYPPILRTLSSLATPLLNPPAHAAWPTLQAATDPQAVAGGYHGPQGLADFRGPSGPAKRKPRATDPIAARRLWDLSIDLTGIDPGLSG